MSTARPRRDRKKEDTKEGAFYENLVVGDTDLTSAGNKMWVQEGDIFKKAVVKEKKGDNLIVQLEEDKSDREVQLSDVHPMNPDHLEKVPDMARLTHLNEPSVYYDLAQRYGDDLIYTYSGLFLVVVNPYKRIPIYTQEVVDSYKGKTRDDMPPHVFSLAESAYRSMTQNKINQSMLVTGESGAGKTENTKKIIQYLTSVASSKQGSGELEQQIVRTNPLLEAFGNAKTIKNNNSSRFGKFIEIGFNATSLIVGTKITNYLLETTRVIDRGDNERNFHIFYQIFTDSALTNKFNLTKVEDYEFLNRSITKVDGMDDTAEWKETKKSMDIIGINEKEQEMILGVIAACLHFGNVKFTADKGGNAEIADKTAMKLACKHLGVNAELLERGITKPKIVVNKEEIETQETPQRADFNAKALVKSIYRRLFNWLVQRVNETLSSKDTVKNSIGLLDIAGFEIFQNNSFEQLCINFTNEKLQQFFNNHMFKKEQEEYLREKIEWKFIDFGLDLQPTIDLIEKNNGVFAICDEQTTLGNSNDKVLTDMFRKNFNNHEKFSLDKFDAMKFNIVHYAGTVTYDCDQWLNKNTDPLTADSETVMSNSKFPQISRMFDTSLKRKKGAKFLSVAREYKEQLETLMTVLRATEPHFIRCIIPNHKMRPGYLEPSIILSQLRCNGVLEGIRIARKGYPNRIIFNEFIQRYKVIAKQEELEKIPALSGQSKLIVECTELKEKTHYMIGQTKVFFKAGAEALIEKIRDKKISEIILCAQAAIRGYLARKEYKRIIAQQVSCKLIQQNWRTFLSLKNWPWWQVLVIARSQVDPEAGNKETEEFKKTMEDLKVQLDEESRDKKRVQKEKGDVLVEIERLKGEIMSNDQKVEDGKTDLQRLSDREKELAGQIDGLGREKNIIDTDNRQNTNKLNEQETILRDKEKEIDDLNNNLGSGSEEGKKLRILLDQIQKEKLKLEVSLKQLDEDTRETRGKLDSEILKAGDLERQKTQLEDKLKEQNYKLQNVTKDKQTIESKFDETVKTLKENDTQLKQSLDQIQALMSDDSKKTSDISISTSELDEVKRKLDTLEREKKNLETSNRDLEERTNESETKKTMSEKQLRNAKDDFKEYQTTHEKLRDEFQTLEDKTNTVREETGQLKIQLVISEDEVGNLNRKKTDFEKDISNLNFEINELKSRNERAIEAATKKLTDTERDLTEQINSQNQQKTSVENKSKQFRDQYSETKKQLENLTSEKDALDQKYKRLEQNLTGEQQEGLAIKKQTNDLGVQTRSLQIKLKEIETKLKGEQDDNTRLEQKRIQLQSTVNEQKDHNDSLEKEKEELEREKNSSKSSLQNGKQELDLKKESVNQLKIKTSSQDSEVKNLKDKIETSTKGTETQKNKNKDLEGKLSQASTTLETEKTEKRNIESKIQKAEQTLAKLKIKLQEETEKTKKEEEGKSNSDSLLKDIKSQIESEQKKIAELNRKMQELQTKSTDIDLSSSDESSKSMKIRSNISALESKKSGFVERTEDLTKKFQDGEQNKQLLKQKLDDAEKQRQNETVNSQKFSIENQKMKTDLEKLRISADENERKSLHSQESTKLKLDSLEQDHEMVLRRLNDEKMDLKKQIKNAAKYASKSDDSNDNSGEGKVTQEAIDKVTRESNEEIEKLRAELENNKKERLAIEAQKRNFDMQLSVLRDQLEQEERARKKYEVQKKSLQLECDEVKALADESEDIKEEIDQVKLESESYARELLEEKEREKKLKDSSEEVSERRKTEVDNIKKTLSEEKQTAAQTIKALRSKYEREVMEMEELVEKARREKLSNSRGSKKLDKNGRDLQRKLQNAEMDLRVAEEKALNLDKELRKLQNEAGSQGRKLASLEGENKLLDKDSAELRQRLKENEDQLSKLKSKKGVKVLEDDDDN